MNQKNYREIKKDPFLKCIIPDVQQLYSFKKQFIIFPILSLMQLLTNNTS